MVSADWSAYHECSGRGSVTSSPGQPFFPSDYYLITLIAEGRGPSPRDLPTASAEIRSLSRYGLFVEF